MSPSIIENLDQQSIRHPMRPCFISIRPYGESLGINKPGTPPVRFRTHMHGFGHASVSCLSFRARRGIPVVTLLWLIGIPHFVGMTNRRNEQLH
jgi:hypothetical protein